jgi:hypothetical protein
MTAPSASQRAIRAVGRVEMVVMALGTPVGREVIIFLSFFSTLATFHH